MKKNTNYKIIIILILTIIIIISAKLFITSFTLKETNENKVFENILIKNIINKINNDEITEDFLYWIYNNYGINSLLELNKIIEKNYYTKEIWHKITGNSYNVLKDLFLEKYTEMPNVKIINKQDSSTLTFIGDVSLADNWYIMPKYDERKKEIYGILSEDIVKIMTESDIMIANNEFTISNRGEKMPGKYYTFRASPNRLSIYTEMGVDLLTLANNHVYDFGTTAFNDTIDYLNEFNIPYIGAGKNIDEAKRPYYFIINGYKIAFVNATRAEKIILTPEATTNSGGVFRCYDPTNLINLIKETKQESDYIITLIHWGKEDSHELEPVQKETSKLYIDAGSDIIIGTHAHVLQGIEFYKNKPIIYNLGDFIFNNETKDTGIFQIILNSNGNMNYYFIPAYQSNEYTKLLEKEENQRIINLMNSWSINAKIDELGKIDEIK